MKLLLIYENATGLFVGRKWTGIMLVPQNEDEEKLISELLKSQDVIGPSEMIEVGKYKNEYFNAQAIKQYGGKKVLMCIFGPRE